MTFQLAILYLHLVAAMFWIGEMLVLALVITPVAARLPAPGERARLYGAIGRQSRTWMFGALALLVATGIGNLWAMGITAGALVDASFYQSPFGRTLGLKLLLVLVILAVTFVHDAAMRRLGAGSGGRGPIGTSPGDPVRYRAMGRWMGRANLLLGLIVAWLGLRLVAGHP